MPRNLAMILALTCLGAATLSYAPLAHAAEAALPARLRRPAALALSADAQFLYVANRRSGSLSVVDLSQRRAIAELDVGKNLADLAPVGERRLLACDEGNHELLLLETAGATVNVLSRVAVSGYPVELTVTQDRSRAYVASLWSQRVTEVRLPQGNATELATTRHFDLPFAPRKLLLTQDDSHLIVGDAFAGRLAILDLPAGKLQRVHEFPAHNIRGLSVTPDGQMLAVAHQMLNELAHTVRNDVHWGLLMSNDLRWLRLATVLDTRPTVDLYVGAHMHPLGDAGRGGADPSDLAVAPGGLMVVAMGGANQVALGKEQDFSLRRIAVGRRPTAVIVSHDGKTAYVANTFSDSISLIDLEREEAAGEITLGPMAEMSLADRGELLFYDGGMSHDRWMSCHSCHTDGHTNQMLNDNLSDASFGSPKRVLSLLGVADTAPFAWNGSVVDLETQTRASISKTMQRGEPPTPEEVDALVAYLRTLAPPPSMPELREVVDLAALARGKLVFESQKCDRCHVPSTYTSPQSYDVGLEDKQGNRQFNPPSPRGVSQRGPYFHDNRAGTLEDVFRVHGHQLQSDLSDEETADLAAYLRSL